MRTKSQLENIVVCDHGNTYILYSGIAVEYKYKWWWFRFNPRLLFPSFRRDHQKYIYVNGRRRGYAEVRQGYIPVPLFRRVPTNFGSRVGDIIRRATGLCCRPNESGYYRFKIGPFKYTVTKRISADGLLICEVYETGSNNQIGLIVFNDKFNEVYPKTSKKGVTATLCVIAGYVADTAIYSRAAAQLQQMIKIKI